MTRPAVDVRRATAEDTEDLLLLWAQARDEVGPTNRALIGTSPDAMRPRLHDALAGDEVHVLLSRWEGRPAGYAVLRLAPLLPVVETRCVHVEHLYVVPPLRRHGIARAMLHAVASVAERSGAEQVVSNAPPSARETQRFLARLGFTPFVVRRVATTALLRRRLAGESRRSALEDLLSRRRSLRARSGRRTEAAAPDGPGPSEALDALEVLPEPEVVTLVDEGTAQRA